MSDVASIFALKSRLTLVFLLAIGLSSCPLSADEGDSASHAVAVQHLLSQHCLECHNETTTEGGLNLQELQWAFETESNRQSWMRIHDRVAKGEMPPTESPTELSEHDRATLLTPLAVALHKADYKQVQQFGRGRARRLNSIEYENNLRDLLQLTHLDIRDFLPEDREAYQSNKAAEALDLSRVQLSAYLDTADVALRQAVARGTESRTPNEYHALATNMFPKAVDHAGRESTFYAKNSRMVPLSDDDLQQIRQRNEHDPEMEVAIFRSAAWPYYGYPEGFLASDDGQYRVRFKARAVRQMRDFHLIPSPTSQAMTFRARQPSEADVSGDVRGVGGIIDVQAEPRVYETTIYLKRGETFEYSLLGLPVPHPITSHGGPLYYDFPPLPEGGHCGVAFQWLEVSGPIDPQLWPPRSHRVLFDDLPIRQAADTRLGIEVVTHDPQGDASRLLRRFADQAACQPVPEEAVARYLLLVKQELQADSSFAEAMLAGYRAFLCSTHFLFLPEPKSSMDQRVIAWRLSHLLWNSRPDDRLLEVASSGDLTSENGLRHEAMRLIEHDRFEDFVRNFSNYWLDLKNVRRDTPDIRLYPEYRGDDYLIESMERETQTFLLQLFRENLPVSTLVDADFVMINDRLAKHYELPQVDGSSMRRIQLSETSPRGGLLTQAAILKVTSNGTATSPVVRGAWVMDRIMGDPPPPPPAGVPAVEPDLRGATTIRELLAKHAESSVCASCHASFDPVGMALESFDILGGFRTRYRSLQVGDEVTGIDRAGHEFSYHVANEVDSRGQLEDGRTFEDVVDLKQILASQERQIAHNLIERLVVYATGSPVRFSDRREVNAILDRCAPDGYRMRDLLLSLIQNRVFLGDSP